MCSGRVDEEFVWHAFEKGAPIVLVSGCHFSDCHYVTAVTWTQRRVEKMWDKMEKLGIRPFRLQLEYISAAEGQKFAKVMREMDNLLAEVTPEEVEETRKKVAEYLEEERQKTRKRKRAAMRKQAGGARFAASGAVKE